MSNETSTPQEAAVLREVMRLYLLSQRRALHVQGVLPQGRFLVLLMHNAPLTQAEFGRILGLEKSWVSRMIDKLVEQDWVMRTPHPDDKRSFLLQLTTAGMRLAKQVDAQMSTHACAMLDCLTPSARKRIISSLQELRTVLQTL